LARGGCKAEETQGSGTIGTESRLYFLKAEAFSTRQIEAMAGIPEFSGETKKWYDFEKPPKRIDSSTQGAFEVKGLPGTVLPCPSCSWWGLVTLSSSPCHTPWHTSNARWADSLRMFESTIRQ
jgi:hypothetical protein